MRNPRIADKSGEFTQAMVSESARLIRSGAVPTNVYFIPANIVRRLVRRAMANLRKTMSLGAWVGGPIATLGGGLLLGLSLLGNVDALRVTTRRRPPRHVSSFVMRMSVDAPRIYDQEPDSSNSLRGGKRRAKGSLPLKSRRYYR